MTDQITIHDRSIIRPFSHHTARGIGIHRSALLGNGIMIYHGIHISGRYNESKSRRTENGNGSIIFPVRLWDNSYRISVWLEDTGNNRMTEWRMIHISITTYINKVKLLDSTIDHILFWNWKITFVHYVSLISHKAYLCKASISDSVSLRYSPGLRLSSVRFPSASRFR